MSPRDRASLPMDAPPDEVLDASSVDASGLDPASLPSPISRRRAAMVAIGLVLALVVVAFGRQVGDASAASARADELRTSIADLQARLVQMQSDLATVGSEQYVGVAGRGYGLGKKHEIAFTLAADAPALPPDAPGSAALRVGGQASPPSPLESWLDLLFGPAG